MRDQLKTALLIFFILTLITGAVYPFFVTGIAGIFFQDKAGGSLIIRGPKAVGSSLIGQEFDDPKYLWGRPSATAPVPFNSAASSGSNLGPSSVVLIDTVKRRVEILRSADPGNNEAIPIDLVTSSASGLDPHISPAGAYYQVPRIARRRAIPENIVKNIIKKNTTGRLLGFIGEPIVNVVGVNLDLDYNKK